MPPKIRVVKPSIGSDNVPAFVKQFVYEVSQGTFDTHLDILFMAIDERVRNYQRIDIPNDEETQKKLALVRKYRGLDFEPAIAMRYGVFGESYRGVEVTFHGEAKPYDNGQRRARVEIMTSAGRNLEVGSYRLIPMSALMKLPEVPVSEDTTLIHKI